MQVPVTELGLGVAGIVVMAVGIRTIVRRRNQPEPPSSPAAHQRPRSAASSSRSAPSHGINNDMLDPANPIGLTNPYSPLNPIGLTNPASPNNPLNPSNPISPFNPNNMGGC